MIRAQPRRRSRLAATVLSLGAGIAAALITAPAMPISSAATAAEKATTPEPITRALTCDEDTGAGTGPDPAGTLTIGPVGLLGVAGATPLTLTRVTDGVLWFKSYIVIPNSREARVVMSVRSLSGGKVGLDWGTQTLSANKHPHYTPLSSLRATTLSMPLCNGNGAGFPGGFVMTKPLCAQITVSVGKVSRSDRLSFGGAPCPLHQM
jgi:hypothetical protein